MINKRTAIETWRRGGDGGIGTCLEFIFTFDSSLAVKLWELSSAGFTLQLSVNLHINIVANIIDIYIQYSIHIYGISNSKHSIILFIKMLRQYYANFGVSDLHDLPATAVSMLHMSCSRAGEKGKRGKTIAGVIVGKKFHSYLLFQVKNTIFLQKGNF